MELLIMMMAIINFLLCCLVLVCFYKWTPWVMDKAEKLLDKLGIK